MGSEAGGYHLAQLNVARFRAPLSDPSMADFVRLLPEVNALADAAPGFVWRLVAEGSDDATSLRLFDADTAVNLSVWTSIAALRDYVYRGPHLDALRRRREWFDRAVRTAHLVLWWIPAGRLPTLDEAGERLKLLERDGPTPEAFTLRTPYPPPLAEVARSVEGRT